MIEHTKFQVIITLLFVLCLVPHIGYAVNDPYYEYQDYLVKIGFYPNSVDVRGDGVVVAVIDEGVWHGHPDLANNMWTNSDEVANNGIDDDGNGYVDDYWGWNFLDSNQDVSSKGSHGTAVAGIIASRMNSYGIVGIAPSAKIMALTACDDFGCDEASVINAIYYAVDNGADIINMSLGSSGYVGYSSSYDTPIQYAYDHDVFVVVSAGNGDVESVNSIGQNLTYAPVSPVCNDVEGYNIVLGVGAYDANWSNYGDCVDVNAPGNLILTSVVPAHHMYGWDYDFISGTSFSAPMVAATAALLMNQNSNLKNFEIMDYIIELSNHGNLHVGDILDDTLPAIKIDSVSGTSFTSGETVEISGEHFRYRDIYISSDSYSMKISTTDITYKDSESAEFSIPSILPTGTYKVKLENSNDYSPEFSVISSGGSSGSSQSDSGTTSEISNGSNGSDVAQLGGQYNDAKHDDSLINRLKGWVMLQTDEHGEAWYLHPDEGIRYYMKNGGTAYEMMRAFGLGISNSDLEQIPSVEDAPGMDEVTSVCSTNSLADRLKGYILLQVEEHGEAWYIHPEKCHRIYMQNGDVAYSIMRWLSMGISNDNLAKIPSGDFE